MRPYSVIVTVLLASVIISGCDCKVELEARKQELIELNKQMREAHLSGDTEAILAINAYPYVGAHEGKVLHPTKEENDKFFTDYTTNWKLTAWDDLCEPVITISDDGSMATVIYRKYLAMVPVEQPDGEPYEGIYAWQSTYRYTPEGWKQISDVLTSLPEDEVATELEALGR